MTSSERRPAVGLHGRDREIDALDEHLDALRRGRGGVVLVEGPAGCGRTRIVEEALARAERIGLRTAHAVADAAARQVPMAPLLDALLGGEEPLLDAARLRDVAGLADPRFWELREIQERLAAAAAAGPLVIAVDDVHAADDATRLALRVLPGRLAGHAILWILTARPAAAASLADGAHVLAPAPLSRGAVRQIAHDVLGAAPHDAIVELAGDVRGRPALLIELLCGLRDEGLVDVRDGCAQLVGEGLPLRFRDAVDGRLAELSAAARGAVEMASALGPRFTVEQLATLLERRPAAMLSAVHEALAEDLLVETGDALTFRHELVREAVEAGLPASARVALRRQAVDLLLERDAVPAEVAPLLIEVAAPGDRAAIAVLRRAAADLAATAPATAAAASRRALELTPPGDPERGVAVAETIPFLVAAGHAADARELADTALAGALAPEAEATLRLSLAHLSLHDAHRDAIRQCRRALALPGVPGELALQLRVVLGFARALNGDWDALRASAADDLAAARAAGPGPTLRLALTNAAAAAYASADYAGACAFADEADELAGPWQAEAAGAVGGDVSAALRAWLRGAIGAPEQALAAVDEGLHRAERHGRRADARWWRSVRCRLRLSAGRVADARADAEAILESAGICGDGPSSMQHAHYVLGRAAVHMGDQAAVRAAAAAAHALRLAHSTSLRRTGAWLGAVLADAEGDATRARVLADDALGALGTSTPAFAEPAEAGDLLELLRLVLRADDRRAGAEVVAELERRAARNTHLPALAALAEHGRAMLDDDRDALALTMDRLPVLPGDLCRARMLEDVAAGLDRSRAEDAVRCYDHALGLYAELGCEHDAARIRRRLRERGVRRRRTAAPEAAGWADLTASELAVVALVAEGTTNREAAERLFLSPHTVSSHLRHAFGKLGISSRVELARLYAEHVRAGER